MTVEHSALVETAHRGFSGAFGSAPSGVWYAPGRVNVIGEHTDYNDGFVLPFALDRGVAAAAALRNDGWVNVISEQTGSVRFAVEGLGRSGSSLGYAEGAIWAAATAGIEIPGLDVFATSTLPIGAGLSSSSAFICALLVTVNELAGHSETPGNLAMMARQAEVEGVGVPIGVMDPMVSMVARVGHALLIDCQSLEHQHVELEAATPGADTEILIVDTRTERALAAGEYAERRRACEVAASVLGVPSLRSVSIDHLDEMSSDLDEVILRRARHVVTENARVLHAVGKLREGDVAGLGRLLDASHTSLAEDFEVSAPALDLAVEVCHEVGAYGARLTGAGFGGCAIGLFPAGSISVVEASMRKAFADRDMRSPRILAGVSGPPAGRLLA